MIWIWVFIVLLVISLLGVAAGIAIARFMMKHMERGGAEGGSPQMLILLAAIVLAAAGTILTNLILS